MPSFPGPAPAPRAALRVVSLEVALLAAVVLLLAGCGQASSPGGGAATPGRNTPVPSTPATPARVPAALFHTALDCPAGTDVLILQRLWIVLDRLKAVVVARCDSGAGSPPSGVFVVEGQDAAARITATLIRPSAQVQISSVATTPGGLVASGLGYSTPDVPRCCPDRRLAFAWRIDGAHLVETG